MTRNLDHDEVQQLETLVRLHGLSAVLMGLSLVCHNMAVSVAKDDAAIGKAWISLGDSISLAAIKAEGL